MIVKGCDSVFGRGTPGILVRSVESFIVFQSLGKWEGVGCLFRIRTGNLWILGSNPVCASLEFIGCKHYQEKSTPIEEKGLSRKMITEPQPLDLTSESRLITWKPTVRIRPTPPGRKSTGEGAFLLTRGAIKDWNQETTGYKFEAGFVLLWRGSLRSAGPAEAHLWFQLSKVHVRV